MKRRLGLGIVLVVRDLKPRGASRYAITMGRAVADMGPSVLVLAGGRLPDDVESAAGFEVRVLPEVFRPVVGWMHLRRATQALPAGYRLVHAAEVDALPVAARLAGTLGASLLLTVHSFEEAAARGGAELAVSRVVAVSEALRAHLVNEAGIQRDLLVTVPDGVDIERFRVKPAFEGAERRPVVGWLGRLVPEKGPLEFLKVAARIEEEGRTAEFLLAGEGPLKDAVRTMADDLGLRQKITFVFEGVEPEAVLPVMDVFVSTSRSEGLGLTVIEAMACGKPVVATAQGGQFDVVRDGHTGFLYRPGDIDTCAAKTLSLIDNPEAAREMGVNGREIVEEEFDARKVAVKLMEVYEQILNEST